MVGEDGYTGLDVVRASRIAAVGRGGQVLLSDTTRAIVASDLPDGVSIRSLGDQRLKDIDQPEPLHELHIDDVPVTTEPALLSLRPETTLPDEALAKMPGWVREIATQLTPAAGRASQLIEDRVLAEIEASFRERSDSPADRPPSAPSVADEIAKLRALLRLTHLTARRPNGHTSVERTMRRPEDYESSNRSAIARVMDAFEAFQREMSVLHAPELVDLSLTLAQLKAIYLVATAGPLRMCDLAARMGVAPSTPSGLVDRLVQLGLLDRFEDPANRRQVLVRATRTAIEQIQAMSELNQESMRRAPHLQTVEEIETIERAIRLMTAAASEMSTENNT